MKPEQITAWALDEASAEERQQLEAALLENPQDKQKADETKAFCDFLLSELRDDSLALTDKQRERLVAQASGVSAVKSAAQAPAKINGAPVPRPASRTAQTKWRIGVIVRLSLAACAVLGGFWTWQVYSEKGEMRAVAHADLAEKPGVKVQLAPKPEAKKQARLLTEAPKKVVVNVAPPAAKPLAAAPAPADVASSAVLALKKDQRVMTPGDVTKLKQIEDQNAYALNFGSKMELSAETPVPASPSVMMQQAASATLPAPPTLASLGMEVPKGVRSAEASLSNAEGFGTRGDISILGGSDSFMAPHGSLTLNINSFPVSRIGWWGLVSVSPIHLADTLDAPAKLAKIDGFIDLPETVLTTGSAFLGPVAYPSVSPQKTGMVRSFFPGWHRWDANGWPSMTTAPLGMVASSWAHPMTGTLASSLGDSPADFRLGMNIGTPVGWSLPVIILSGLSLGSEGPLLGLVLRTASERSGSTMLQVGASLSMNAFLRAHHAFHARMGSIAYIGDDFFNPHGFGTPGSYRGWMPRETYENPNSIGLISFATATQSRLTGQPDLDLISAEKLPMVGALFKSAPQPRSAGMGGNGNAFGDIAGNIGGVGGMTKAGAGTLTLSGATTYTGTTVDSGGTLSVSSSSGRTSTTTTLNGGTVSLGAASAAPTRNSGALVSAGETFDLNGAAQVAAAATGNPALAPTIGDDFEFPSVSFAYSFIHNMGALGNGGGMNHLPGSSASYGMNDIQQLSLGGTTDLAPATLNSQPMDMSGYVAGAASEPEFALKGAGELGWTAIPGALPALNRAAPTAAPSIRSVDNIRSHMNANNFVVGDTSANPQPAAASSNSLTVTAAGATLDLNGTATLAERQATMAGGLAFTNGGGYGTHTVTSASGTSAAAPAANLGGAVALTTAMPSNPTSLGGVTTSFETTGAITVTGDSAAANAGAAVVALTTAIPGSLPMVANREADVRYFSGASVDGSSLQSGWAVAKDDSKNSRRSDVTGESYTRIIENEMKEVAREPLSTLSIDVDTASYANVRRFLNHNLIPPPDAVRIEELINYFPTAEEGPGHEAKEPFAVRVELAPCPWQPVHRLARIAIKGREIDKNRKASNLVFLVDVSGSMNEPAKLPLVQQSLRMLTEQLGEGDRVTMVVYAGSSGVVLPPTSGEKKAEILAAIDRLSAGGSTHGSAGIKLAYEQAVAGFIKGGVNRVILCTDGDFNVGVSSPEELEKLIKHKAKTGVFLSVLGFGSGNLKDRTMETLADKGNGNYAYIDSLSEARKVLVEQMSGTLDTIAKDVKIQVEFNPAAVRSYRLIGYENRLLAKEDFNDDTKDAGEIGAGHSVVALYEVVPANLPAGSEPRPAVDSLKYQAPAISPAQLAEAAKSGEMMTVKLRYKAPDSDLSKLIEVPTKDEGKTLTASTDEFKFSAAVAGFGLLLRDSSYQGNLSWETVRRLALDGKGADKLGYRREFLQLIDKARGLKEAK